MEPAHILEVSTGSSDTVYGNRTGNCRRCPSVCGTGAEKRRSLRDPSGF